MTVEAFSYAVVFFVGGYLFGRWHGGRVRQLAAEDEAIRRVNRGEDPGRWYRGGSQGEE